MISDEVRVNALTELAESPNHLEEARILLAEVYGDELGEEKYTQLLDLMLIKQAIEDSGLSLDQVLTVRPGNKVVEKRDAKVERGAKLRDEVSQHNAADLWNY